MNDKEIFESGLSESTYVGRKTPGFQAGNAVVWVLVIVVAVFIVGYGIWAAQRDDGFLTNGENGIESINQDSESITDQDGNILVSLEDFPAEVDVSSEASFGGADEITGAELSPDGEWIALTTRGAAHGFGWLYNVSRDDMEAVDFQFGGSVQVEAWEDESRYVAFRGETPRPATVFKIVEVRNIAEFPSETGFLAELPEDSAISPEEAEFENVGWEDGMFCFSADGERYCADPETEEVMREDEMETEMEDRSEIERDEMESGLNTEQN